MLYKSHYVILVLILQIIKTLRYDFNNKGWINKIGLRNKGIDWAIKTYDKNSIVSIAILEHKEIDILNKKIPKKMDLELNISCPNVKNNLIHDDLYKFLNKEREWCCIKLSPVTEISLDDNISLNLDISSIFPSFNKFIYILYNIFFIYFIFYNFIYFFLKYLFHFI